MSQKKENKAENSKLVSVTEHKGRLRLQLASNLSLRFFAKKQKYKALGLTDTPENRIKANECALMAERDILTGEFDLTLEKYLPINQVKTSGVPLESIEEIPHLKELYQVFCQQIQSTIAFSTYEQRYQYTFLKLVEACPQDIRKAKQIRDVVIEKTSSKRVAKDFLNCLGRVIDFAIEEEMLPEDTKNTYNRLAARIRTPSKLETRKYVQDNENSERRAFTPEEAQAIIEEFSFRGCPQGKYVPLVKFLFLTGCRTQEAAGLRWGDINLDCSHIIFKQALERRSKKPKPLKTQHVGGKIVTRNFSCGAKLQQLLLEIRPDNFNSSDYVFNNNGEPINMMSFYNTWYRCHPGPGKLGVLQKLIKERKVSKYLKPYATRHTFITEQLRNGAQPADVAALVGNTPETIYKHYVSASANPKPVIEI
jgi:integrase